MKILLAVIVLAFTACNTVRKTTSTTTEKTDSISIVKKDNTAVFKSDSTKSRFESNNYQKETVYQFDTVYRLVKGDTVLQYVPRLVKVFEKGNFTSVEHKQQSNYDSAASNEIDSAMKHVEAKTEVKQKQSSRVPIGLIVSGLLAFAMAIVFIYFKRK